jgi:outer membrane cobalamin receptor
MRSSTLIALCCAVIVSACAPSRQFAEPPDGEVASTMARDLTEYLLRYPGVHVRGSGARASIHLSGSDYPNPPLFVIDGVTQGFDFASVYSRVHVTDIESVRIIRANETEAFAYGMRGGNGVVEIVTKRGR